MRFARRGRVPNRAEHGAHGFARGDRAGRARPRRRRAGRCAVRGRADRLHRSFEKISGDDRSFTFYLPDAGAAVETLIADLDRRHLSPLSLVEAYRLYLVANFTASRCADDDVMAGSAGGGQGTTLDSGSADAIRFFNKSVRKPPLQSIQLTEAVALRSVGAASGLRSCASAACAGIAHQCCRRIDAEFGARFQRVA